MIAINLVPEPRKKCTRCCNRFPASFFNKSSQAVDGLSHICKRCKSEKAREYYQRRREHVLDKQKRYYDSNSERVKAYVREYQKDGEYYYSKHPDERREKRRRDHHSRYARPVTKLVDQMRTQLRRTIAAKRPYTKKSKLFSRLGFTQAELRKHLFQWLGNPCELCGVQLTRDNAEIDHIIQLCTAQTEEDVWRLNALENLRLICGPCNKRRYHQRKAGE